MVYLNNAATSFPKPLPVIESVVTTLQSPPLHHARTGFDDNAVDAQADCRNSLCRLFHAEDPCRIVFTSGSTESLNLAIRGLDLQGKHAITTAVEHNSVLRPLKTLEKNGVIALTIVDCDQHGYVPPENIERAIRSDTAAVVVNHCSNVTGVVNDLHVIGHLLADIPAAFIVDASQSAGVVPIDVQEMNIDFLAFTGHKSLYGVQGTGGAYIAEHLSLQPLIVGGTGVRSDLLYQPEEMPTRFEAGTQNMPGIAALCKGVEFVLEQGVERIRSYKRRLVARMRERMSRNPLIRLYPAEDCPQATTLFSFNISGMNPDDVGYMLDHSFGVETRSGLHCAPLIHRHIGTFPHGSVRVSPSYFTTEEDVDVFLDAIDAIAEAAT